MEHVPKHIPGKKRLYILSISMLLYINDFASFLNVHVPSSVLIVVIPFPFNLQFISLFTITLYFFLRL